MRKIGFEKKRKKNNERKMVAYGNNSKDNAMYQIYVYLQYLEIP